MRTFSGKIKERGYPITTYVPLSMLYFASGFICAILSGDYSVSCYPALSESFSYLTNHTPIVSTTVNYISTPASLQF